jgi:hypothetical protein
MKYKLKTFKYKDGEINNMNKRGQVSTFLILGIVLVIVVALVFFVRKQSGIGVSPGEFLSDKLKPIERDLKSCVDKQEDTTVKLFLQQGGDFFPDNYRLYQGKKVRYFCMNIPEDNKCLNVMKPLGVMMDELNIKLQQEIGNCVNKELLKPEALGGYSVSSGLLTTNTQAVGSGLLITVNYDVELSKNEEKTKLRKVNRVLDVPIKELYDVSFDAVNSEAQFGFFEQLFYMLGKKGKYLVNIDKPFPDKIYKINKNGNEHELWFAVQGEPS